MIHTQFLMLVWRSTIRFHHDKLIELLIQAKTVPLITARFPLNTEPVRVPNGCDWNIIGIHLQSSSLLPLRASEMLVWKKNTFLPPHKCISATHTYIYIGLTQSMRHRLCSLYQSEMSYLSVSSRSVCTFSLIFLTHVYSIQNSDELFSSRIIF